MVCTTIPFQLYTWQQTYWTHTTRTGEHEQLNDNELEGTIPVELGKLKLTKLFEL